MINEDNMIAMIFTLTKVRIKQMQWCCKTHFININAKKTLLLKVYVIKFKSLQISILIINMILKLCESLFLKKFVSRLYFTQ